MKASFLEVRFCVYLMLCLMTVDYYNAYIHIQIYNETIRDLLGDSDDQKKHEIKKGHGDVYVTDVEEVEVTSEDRVYSLLAKAARNRSVARTMMNEHSSRSHSVFRLHIAGKNALTGELKSFVSS